MDIEGALTAAEAALDAGRSLAGTGFWAVVREARRDRDLAERYADRIAAIDLRAFERGVRLRMPAPTGVALLFGASAFGAAAVRFAVAFGDRSSVAVPIAFLIGLGALVVGTHSLTHFLVGRVLGIRFTHVFLGGPKPPRPGVKTEYASYLRASSPQRAVMHASGAIVTKIVPFALLAASLELYDEWPWLTWLLLALGGLQILTDVFLSTKVSDWMKVRRELSSRASRRGDRRP